MSGTAVEAFSPVQIENAIRECATRIANSVSVCANAYAAWLAADRVYDQVFAQAFLDYDGPAHSKKYAAEIATVSEREARDVADAAYRYADRKARALTEELRAWQSVNASLRVTYQVAGVGER